MPTLWTYPTTVTQFAESPYHISWNDKYLTYAKNDDEFHVGTVAPLYHIPNSFSGDRTMKTWYLKFSGYLTTVTKPIVGLQVKFKSERSGRIIEDTVQFMYQDQFVGDNRANGEIAQIKYYGGKDDWGFLPITDSTATLAILSDPSFAIAIRLQSHPSWPHREAPMVDFVSIRGIYNTDVLVNGNWIDIERAGLDPSLAKADGEGGHLTAATGSSRNPGLGGSGQAPGYGGSNYGFSGSSPGYTGSAFQYIGSEGGSGYTGSQGVPGVDVTVPPPGYIGSLFSSIHYFTSIPNPSYLPTIGQVGVGYQIQSDGSIRYWDPVYGGYLYLSR